MLVWMGAMLVSCVLWWVVGKEWSRDQWDTGWSMVGWGEMGCWIRLQHHELVDTFTVSLHSPKGRHLLVIKAMYGDSQWPLKNGGNATSHTMPQSIVSEAMSDQPITTWCQQIGGHVLYPADTPYYHQARGAFKRRIWVLKSKSS